MSALPQPPADIDVGAPVLCPDGFGYVHVFSDDDSVVDIRLANYEYDPPLVQHHPDDVECVDEEEVPDYHGHRFETDYR